MNPHPVIFPILIEKYNLGGGLFGSRYFYDYLSNFGVSRAEAKEIKQIIQKWIEDQGGSYTGEYFNEF